MKACDSGFVSAQYERPMGRWWVLFCFQPMALQASVFSPLVAHTSSSTASGMFGSTPSASPCTDRHPMGGRCQRRACMQLGPCWVVRTLPHALDLTRCGLWSLQFGEARMPSRSTSFRIETLRSGAKGCFRHHDQPSPRDRVASQNLTALAGPGVTGHPRVHPVKSPSSCATGRTATGQAGT